MESVTIGPMAAAEGALVLFSGGQDSATCLAWALRQFDRVETIGFDYGQRHAVELEVRRDFLARLPGLGPWRGTLGPDHVVDLRGLAALGATAMTEEVAFAAGESGLPNTFVPGRNLAFFVLAAAMAWRRGLRHLVGGMCETDYSGYPDCRDDTLKALQAAISLGLDRRVVIHTPLMWLDKAATWRLAEQLGGAALVAAIVDDTHSCYRGDRSIRHDWGFGCGTCPACALREGGWARYRADPTA